ncbi:MAG: hypothetical protein RLZZ117_745, partial [Cyanobacteriota bacterium]
MEDEVGHPDGFAPLPGPWTAGDMDSPV